MINFTSGQNGGDDLLAGREIQRFLRSLARARKSISDPRARQLIRELAIDLRAVPDQECSSWLEITGEDLSDK